MRGKYNLKGLTQRTPAALAATLLLFVALSAIAVPAAQAEGFDHPVFGNGPYFLDEPYNTGMPVETDLMVPWVPASLGPVAADLYDALTITLPEEFNAFDEDDLAEAVQGVASCPNPAELLEPVSSAACIPYEEEGEAQPGNTGDACDGALLTYCFRYDTESDPWSVHVVFSDGQALGSLLSLRLPGTVSAELEFGLKAEFGGDEIEEDVHYSTTPIPELQLRTASGGAGEEITEFDLREGSDDEQTVYAAAYDDGGFIDDAWVQWSAGDFASVDPEEGIETTVTPEAEGDDVLTAVHPDAEATAAINVLKPLPTGIKICIEGDCTGTIVDVILGGEKTFDAVDESGDPIDVEWSVDSAIGSVEPASGSNTTFTATGLGSGSLSAQFEGGVPEATRSLQVKEGDLGSIRICQEAGGCDEIAERLTFTAGENETLFAAAYNENEEFIGDESADWSIDDPETGEFDGNTFQPMKAREATITADVGGLTDNLDIEVVAGEFDALEIQNEDDDPIGGDPHLQAGTGLDLYAVGFDAFGNKIGPTEADWTVLGGIGDVEPATGDETVFTAMYVGSGRVRATSDGVEAQTGLIHVIPGPLDDLIIQHGSSSGAPPANAFVTTTDGEPDKDYRHWVLWAVGYDAYGNWIGPIADTDWSIDGDAYGNVTETGPSTIFKPHTPGIATVSASSSQNEDGFTAEDETGPITIVHGALRVLKIQDAPDGLGEELGELEMEAGDTQQMWAAGYDGDENYVGDRPVNWTVNPDCGELMEIPGLEESPGIIFQATRVVNEGCFVTAHHEGEQTLPGTDIEITVETTGQAGPITVNPGPAVDLTITDENGEVSQPDYTAGDQVTLIAEMADEYGNSVGDEVEADWRVDGDCGTLDQETGSRVIFEARTATEEEDDCRVFAEVETESLLGLIPQTLEADTGNITVVPQNSAASVKIRSQGDNQGIELTEITRTTDETQTVYAAAYDAQFNYIGDLEGTVWSLAAGDEDSIDYNLTGGSSTLEPEKPGTVTLEAGVHGVTAQLDVIMELGVLANIQVRDDNGDAIENGVDIDAREAIDLSAFGLDAKNNTISALSVNWTVPGGCGNVAPPSGDTTTFTAGVLPVPGCTVEATHEGLVKDIGEITVITPPAESVLIRDSDGDEVEALSLNATETRTLHAAGFVDFGGEAEPTYIGDQEGTWSVLGGCGVFVDESGEELMETPSGVDNVTFQARHVLTGNEECTIQVDVDGLTGVIDETGFIDVSPGPLKTLEIHSGGELVDELITVPSGETHDFEAVGFDAFGNLRDSEPASWSITENPACGSFRLAESSAINTFEGVMALDCVIRAGISGINDTADIKVTPGDAHELEVLVQGDPPVIGGSVPAREAFNIWVHVRDRAGNKVIGDTSTVTMTADDDRATVGKEGEEEPLKVGVAREVIFDRASFDDVRLYRSDLTEGRELTLEASAPGLADASATLRIIAGDPAAFGFESPETVSIDDPAEVTLFVFDAWDNLVEDEQVINVSWGSNSNFAQGSLVVEGDQIAPVAGEPVQAETEDGEVHAVLHVLSVDTAHEYEVKADAGGASGSSGPIQVVLPEP